MTINQSYDVLKRHEHLLNHTARSFIWLYDTYMQTGKNLGTSSPHAMAWRGLAAQACENSQVQNLCTRLLRLESVGVYLNDDGKHDCSRCRLRDCRWRGRDERQARCVKNYAGAWLYRSPKIV